MVISGNILYIFIILDYKFIYLEKAHLIWVPRVALTPF